jgi:hypothetical protein
MIGTLPRPIFSIRHLTLHALLKSNPDGFYYHFLNRTETAEIVLRKPKRGCLAIILIVRECSLKTTQYFTGKKHGLLLASSGLMKPPASPFF